MGDIRKLAAAHGNATDQMNAPQSERVERMRVSLNRTGPRSIGFGSEGI